MHCSCALLVRRSYVVLRRVASGSRRCARGRAGGGSAVGEVFDGSRPLLAQMSEQNIAEFVAGAAAQGVQDGLVLAHSLAPALALAGEVGGVTDSANPTGKTAVGSQQRRIA